MIVGNGDLASEIIDRDGFLFFASGVSNSGEVSEKQYEREYNLLMEQPKNLRLVYPSSIAVFYSSTRYAQHKRWMENTVKMNFPHWVILRLGNITWGKNPHTFINRFREQKKRGEQLDIWDTYRYVVDKDEFHHWLGLIPDRNCEINVGRRMKVADIVKEYV